VADVDLPEGAEVKRLEYRPGDRIVIKVDHELDDYSKAMLLRDVADAFGEDVPVLVLTPGMDIMVIGPEVPEAAGVVKQRALNALLGAGFDAANARAVLGIGPDEAT
jgi:hypothetical protein